MRIPIMNADSLGIIQDVKSHDLPINAWSSGRNVRFIDGRAEKMLGHQALFTPTIDAKFAMPVKSITGQDFWLYVNDAKAYTYSQGSSTDVTRLVGGDYNAVGQKWSGCILNGVPILNNYTDIPQMWSPVGAASRLTNLFSWPNNWRTKSLKAFKVYLVSLATKKDTVENPYLVNWSHPADPGSVPFSWDITDPTKDAGEATIAETNGHLVDQLELRNANIIYKSDSVYAMTHIGGNDIFAFPRLQKASGLLTSHGLQMITIPGKGDHHVVLGQHDFYLHDGQRVYSPLRQKKRDWLFKNLDPTNYHNAHIVHNEVMQEIWLCFPTVGKVYANIALVWNYVHDTVTERDLPEVAWSASGPIPVPDVGPLADTWANAQGTWADDHAPWGYSGNRPVGNGLLMFRPGASRKAFVADTTTTFDGNSFTWMLERIGLNVLGKDVQGRPIFETDVVKMVREIYPRIEAPRGTELLVHVGTQMNMDKPVRWQGPWKYIVGVSNSVKPLVSGKALSFRFSVTTNANVSFSGYDIDVVAVGSN